MTDDLSDILERIASGEYSEADITALQQALQGEEGRSLLQLGKYNISIGEGKDIQIGDRTFVEINDAAVQAIVEAIRSGSAPKTLAQIDFQPYLRSLVDTYKEWWRYYTLTDATSKIQEANTENPSLFDFSLIVQTVSKEKDSVAPEANLPQEQQEKTERLPVLEGIHKYANDHVLLVGRPGSGKSTALIRLLLGAATQALEHSSGQIPILVELRYWQTSVIDRIQAFLHKHDPTLSLDDSNLSSLLRQGHFLLLVDGLNELPSETARTQLASFRQDYSQVPMIFTTRDLGLGGDLGIEKKLEMQPLTVGQMQAFIRAYIADQAEAMLRQLNDRLREFGQTPLLLWMLCEVFQQSPEHQMPSNLAGVFQAFTRMYEESSVRKHGVALRRGDVRPLSDRRLWKPALKALAAVMMQGETLVDFRVAIHRDEAEQELSRIFSDEQFPVRDILDDLLKYHLLQNRSADQVEFRHQLIQEYYAAEYLLRLLPELSDDQLKRDYLNLLKWTEPIALMLALVDEEEQALRVVKLAIDDIDLIFGARLAGEVRPLFQEHAVDWVVQKKTEPACKFLLLSKINSELALPALLDALGECHFPVSFEENHLLFCSGAPVNELIKILDHPKSSIREKAYEELWKISGQKEPQPDWLGELEHQDPKVRSRSACFIGKIGINSAIPRLIKALEDPEPDVRKSVIHALGKIGGKPIIPELIKLLNDLDANVRGEAAHTLGIIGSEIAIPHLFNLLSHESYYSPEFRRAASAISKIGVKHVVSKLLSNLKDSNIGVRRRAMELFDYFAVEFRDIGDSSVITGLIEAIDDPDPHVRELVANTMEICVSKVAIPSLLKAFEEEDISYVRTKLAIALSRVSSDLATPRLLDILSEATDEYDYYCVISALKEIKSEAAFNGLLKFLTEHTESCARLEISNALGELANEAAIPELLKAFENEKDLFVRGEVAIILGNLCGQIAVPSLMEAFEEINDIRFRRAIAYVLGEIGSETALSGLIKVMREEKDSSLRRDIIASLEKIAGEVVVSVLISTLNDSDSAICFAVTDALARMGDKAAIPSLLKTFEATEKSHLRKKIAYALGEIGSEIAVPKLLKAYEKYKDHDFRMSVIASLGKIGSETAVIELIDMLNDLSPNIRHEAAKALGRVGSARAVPELLIALADNRNSHFCQGIANALKEIGSESAVLGLLNALDDSDFNIRKAAIISLSKISGPQLMSKLWQFYLADDIEPFIITDIQNRCKFYNYEIFQGFIH